MQCTHSYMYTKPNSQWTDKYQMNEKIYGKRNGALWHNTAPDILISIRALCKQLSMQPQPNWTTVKERDERRTNWKETHEKIAAHDNKIIKLQCFLLGYCCMLCDDILLLACAFFIFSLCRFFCFYTELTHRNAAVIYAVCGRFFFFHEISMFIFAINSLTKQREDI